MPLAPLTLALYEPDIAPNAGAMLRSCACFAADAAIIEPAGFVLTDTGLRRAGMDYLDALTIVRHASFARFEQWRAAAAFAQRRRRRGAGARRGAPTARRPLARGLGVTKPPSCAMIPKS